MKVRVRFAPSPTGFIHVGNARTALFNWLFARQKKGVFILRIEDTDIERSAEKYEKQMLEGLRWLGIDWDEGPDEGGGSGPYHQSERLDIYKQYTERLLQEKRAYYCFCSPEQLQKERADALANGKMPIYGGRCRGIPSEAAAARRKAGEEAVVRLRAPDRGTLDYVDLVRGKLSFDLSLIGDSILVRSNGLPAYNYAVVIDDALMGITHVIRGEDHISNTPRQILTYEALGLTPPQFAHLSMVMGEDNARLSKRHGATSVDQFEEQGFLPSALFNYLALLGWSPPEGKEVLSKAELVELFNLGKVSRSSAIFDYEKLGWLNRQHMRNLSSAELAHLAFPFLKKAGMMPERMTDGHWMWLEKACETFVERIDCLSDFPRELKLIFTYSPDEMDQEDINSLRTESARAVIHSFHEQVSGIPEFTYDVFAQITQEIRSSTGLKGKELYHPLRLVLTAKGSGLDLDKFIPLVEQGAKLNFPKPILSCSERVAEALKTLS